MWKSDIAVHLLRYKSSSTDQICGVLIGNDETKRCNNSSDGLFCKQHRLHGAKCTAMYKHAKTLLDARIQQQPYDKPQLTKLVDCAIKERMRLLSMYYWAHEAKGRSDASFSGHLHEINFFKWIREQIEQGSTDISFESFMARKTAEMKLVENEADDDKPESESKLVVSYAAPDESFASKPPWSEVLRNNVNVVNVRSPTDLCYRFTELAHELIVGEEDHGVMLLYKCPPEGSCMTITAVKSMHNGQEYHLIFDHYYGSRPLTMHDYTDLNICLNNSARGTDNRFLTHSSPEEMILGLQQTVAIIHHLFTSDLSERQAPLGIVEFTPVKRKVSGKEYVSKPTPKSYFGLLIDIAKTDAKKLGIHDCDSFVTESALVCISPQVAETPSWWLSFHASNVTKEYKMCQWCAIQLFRGIREYSESQRMSWGMLSYYRYYAESKKERTGIRALDLFRTRPQRRDNGVWTVHRNNEKISQEIHE